MESKDELKLEFATKEFCCGEPQIVVKIFDSENILTKELLNEMDLPIELNCIDEDINGFMEIEPDNVLCIIGWIGGFNRSAEATQHEYEETL